MKVTKLLDDIQARWGLISCMTIVGTRDTLPRWAIEAAQHVAQEVQPAHVAVYRAQLRRRADQLAALHQRWVVAAVLAVLLAMAVVSNAAAFPLDGARLGVLWAVLSAILLPPVAICNGIARDYLAARALATVLSGAVQEPTVQGVN
jgi:hypothetical protein